MDKVMSVEQAVARIRSGDVLLVGGFLQRGSPETLLGALLERDVKDLTIVSNDTGTADTKTIQLMEKGMVSHAKATYIGANRLAGQMLIDDPSSVELVPQGTLAERIRAAGAGLGGILVEVGLGTVAAENKDTLEVDGKTYILEKPLFGDVALLYATIADKQGNLHMKGATKNFNCLMPLAADLVLVEAEKIVEVGELDSEMIHVPGALVDCICQREED